VRSRGGVRRRSYSRGSVPWHKYATDMLRNVAWPMTESLRGGCHAGDGGVG
jgi:hypothetical protein